MDKEKIIGYIITRIDVKTLIENLDQLYVKQSIEYDKVVLSAEYSLLLELIEEKTEYFKSLGGIHYFGNYEVSTDVVMDNLSVAKKRFQHYISELELTDSVALTYETLPDFLSDELMMRLFNWTKSTISTKRSRGELPYIEGLQLTPKKELFEMLSHKKRGWTNPNELEAEATKILQGAAIKKKTRK